MSYIETEDWQEVEGALVTWSEPKGLIGEYRGFVEQDGDFGVQKKHKVIQPDGSAANFFAPSSLARLLEDVQIGQRVKIIYPGTSAKSKSGRMVKQFQVFVARVNPPQRRGVPTDSDIQASPSAADYRDAWEAP